MNGAPSLSIQDLGKSACAKVLSLLLYCFDWAMCGGCGIGATRYMANELSSKGDTYYSMQNFTII